jgi:heme-degrading monooxygenase HmoA
MIARTWHGITPAAKADDYLQLMLTVAVPDYQAIPGNRGVYVLRRLEGETAHFLLLTLWESAEAIRQFAGSAMETAKYYDFDSQYLLELEPTVTHYEVCASPTSGDISRAG